MNIKKKIINFAKDYMRATDNYGNLMLRAYAPYTKRSNNEK
jgi:hypothetical protein